MKTIYISRQFHPVVVDAVKPGDIYAHPEFGECRRVTAKRFCLMAERAGKGSDAFVGLLRAIVGASKNRVYDGMAVADWFGLVGLSPPENKQPELVRVTCPVCQKTHYAAEEIGGIWNDGVCGTCWTRNFYAP